MRAFATRLGAARRPVGQKNVLEPINVVVEETCAFAVYIDQIIRHFIAVNYFHVEAGLLAYIRKNRQRQGARRHGRNRRTNYA